MNRKRPVSPAGRPWSRAGVVLLALNAIQWIAAEAITASAWAEPPYSYATNYISDLGVPDCGSQFQGRDLCSPLHPLMNASFAVEGILFAIAVALLARSLSSGRRVAVTILAIAHGAGMVAVGLFHGSAEGPDFGLALHVAGAGIGILCANAIVMLAGLLRGLGLPTGYRVFSVAIGAAGLVGIALVGISPDTAGIFERSSVYSWLAWGLVTCAMALVHRAGRGRSPLGGRG